MKKADEIENKEGSIGGQMKRYGAEKALKKNW